MTRNECIYIYICVLFFACIHVCVSRDGFVFKLQVCTFSVLLYVLALIARLTFNLPFHSVHNDYYEYQCHNDCSDDCNLEHSHSAIYNDTTRVWDNVKIKTITWTGLSVYVQYITRELIWHESIFIKALKDSIWLFLFLERASVSLLMFSVKQGKHWYHFITSMVWYI